MMLPKPSSVSAAWRNRCAFRKAFLAKLERRTAILLLIARLREESGCQSLGENIERVVVERELRELERAG